MRGERLGFRLDEATKSLIEQAAQIERRKVSEFCLSAITEAAHRTVAQHQTLQLSDRDRSAFFDALINPPAPAERLQRAFADHTRLIEG